jgi:peptidoglycan/xylan/chitin deacetylase (PgdA/CDA1 family)
MTAGVSLVALATGVMAMAAIPSVQAQQGTGQPGTTWTEARLREAVDVARVGRKLTPKSWPNGAKVAVCLSFDTDTEAPLLRDGTTTPTSLSASDFGAQSGMPRILAMLDRHQIPATFFMTGVDAMLHPEMVASVMKSGRHEVGVHGWIHELPTRLTEAEEERLLDQAIEYLTKVTGKKPVGYRAPSWAFSASTLDLILKKGFPLRQQPAGARRAVRSDVARQEHGPGGTRDRLDADRDAIPRSERPDAVAGAVVSAVSR